MNSTYEYNGNAKYSTKDLKDVYSGDNFFVLDAYLNEKGPPVKIQLLNIFKDHHMVAKSGPGAVGYDVI